MDARSTLSLKRYLRRVWFHAKDNYTGWGLLIVALAFVVLLLLVSFPLPEGVASRLPAQTDSALRWLSGILLIASFFRASFLTWKEEAQAAEEARAANAARALLEAVKKSPTLVMKAESALFVAEVEPEDLLPRSAPHFDVRLDVRNPAPTPLFLVDVRVSQWHVASELCGAPGRVTVRGSDGRVKWTELLPSRGRVQVDDGSLRADLAIFVETSFAFVGAEGLAQIVTRLRQWSVSFTASVEDLEGHQTQVDFEASGDFNTFSGTLLRAWQRANRTDLLQLASGRH